MGMSVYASVNKPADTRKKISTNVTIALDVHAIKSSLTQVESITDTLKGYSISTNYTNNDNQISGNIAIRLPNSAINDAIKRIKALAEKVRTVNINTDDLSQQFLQTRSDLSVKQQQMKKITGLMTAATRSKEVASVFNTMVNLQSDINRLEGELNYINNVTELPKITVTLYQTSLAQSIDPHRWQFMSTFNKGLQSLLDTINTQYKGLVFFLIFYLPLILIWLCIAWLLYTIFVYLYQRVYTRQIQKLNS